jgi:hypothetical protein
MPLKNLQSQKIFIKIVVDSSNAIPYTSWKYIFISRKFFHKSNN